MVTVTLNLPESALENLEILKEATGLSTNTATLAQALRIAAYFAVAHTSNLAAAVVSKDGLVRQLDLGFK